MNMSIMQALGKKQDSLKLEYKKDVLNVIFISADGMMFSLAQKLIDEGNNVYVGQVQDKAKDLKQDEDPETKRRRLSCYDGIFPKHDAQKLMAAVEKLENKNDWILICDFNDLTHYGERAIKAGFTKGLFPTEELLKLEKDRNYAKEIVEKHYPALSIGEVHEFKTTEEGIEFMEDSEKLWCLKGNSENAKTLVPKNDDVELNRAIITDALEAHQKDYEEKGYILEEKIVGMYEITPQCVWLNGEVVFTDADIENKSIGSGNVSVQTGCMQNLVFKTKPSAKINKMGFPPFIHEMAKKHPGLFIFDASMLYKPEEDKYYFGEFCANRFGFDSFFTEVAMAGSATDFVTKLFNGENPLKYQYGIATRGLNMHKDDGSEGRRVLEGVSITTDDKENTWIYECKIEDEKYVCTGIGFDLVVFTGAADTVNDAAEKAYEALEDFAFEDLYYRPLYDLMSYEYQSSIPNRFAELNGKIFDLPDMENHEVYTNRVKLENIERRLNQALDEEE